MLRAVSLLALGTTSRAFLRGAPLRASSSATAAMAALFDPSAYINAPQPKETENFVMQQTMVRVKDPAASLRFYCEVLGFKLIMYRDFPQWGFSVYFVAHSLSSPIPDDEDARWAMCMNTPGCVELTHNHGSEAKGGLVYNTGNADATGSADGSPVEGGFGHLGITVPDVYAACARFKDMGAELKKSPNAGGMKGLAFVKDPDGYLIEVLPQGPMVTQPVDCCGVAVEGGEGYKDNARA